MKPLALWAMALVLAAATGGAAAKLPAPSDEAKAKTAEAAAKAAHAGKVDNFKLCASMDQVAAAYYADAKKVGKDTKPPTPTAPCADPGPFVYPPPAVPAAATTTVATPAAPAAAPAAAPKK